MNDRSQHSSYGALYDPPHQRLRSITTPNSHSSLSSSTAIGSPSEAGDRSRIPAINPRESSTPPPASRNQPPRSNGLGSYLNGSDKDARAVKRSCVAESPPPPGLVSAYDDKVSEEGFCDNETDCSVFQPPVIRHLTLLEQKINSRISADLVSNERGTTLSSNIEEWKCKLGMLLQDKEKQEVVSWEKKDRRAYHQIAALASSMGLYSHMYGKVVVCSKVPLPNYRFDLDDKKPQREVSLPLGLLMRVDAYLGAYLFQKFSIKGNFPDLSCSRSSSNIGIATDEDLFELADPLASSKLAMEKILGRISMLQCEIQRAWQDSPEGRKMLEFRKSLPAYKEKDAIMSAIYNNQVVVISGETGCGNWVGYKVRLEGKKGRGTRLLFCTTGILLRRLLVDRTLKGVTHVIVDEIHERGMNEDFLLIVLKDLLPSRPELRLILMSATLDAEVFSSYFGRAPVLKIPGFTYPVKTHFLEDVLELTGYGLTPYSQIDDYGQEKVWKISKQTPRKRESENASAAEDALQAADLEEFCTRTCESLSGWNPDCIDFNLIEHLLCHICNNEKPGAVLVFMTGWEDISSLTEKLMSHTTLGDPGRILFLTCHGSIPSSDQKLIFDEPERGVRKIVLATNIAETSITINDVVFVIDCGKAKETSYDAINNTPCLLPSWISKASAQQRRGRAGRVRPGECYHLYPRCVYNAFREYQLPEILRTPLQSLCLQIKSLKLGSISEFLSRALQSPEPLAVQNAINHLKVIGALDYNENLTVLGQYLTMLPVEPKLGKMLVLGDIFNCLDPVLTVVAGLSVGDPFLTLVDKKDMQLARAAKSQFSRDYSDHLALIRAYEGWNYAEENLAGFDYCWQNFLSAQLMKAIESRRRQFVSLLKDTRLIDVNTNTHNAWSYDEHLIRAVICYGLYPGTSSCVNNGRSFSLKTMEDGQILVSSNSVNSRESYIPYPWLVFNEKLKVNAVSLRDSTAVSDSALILFGGNILKGEVDGHLKMLGGFIEFFMEPGLAEMYLSLRRELDELIQIKLLNPKVNIHTHHELLSAVRLLISEDQCEGKFVFGGQVLKPSKVPAMPRQPVLVLGVDRGPGGNKPKSRLRALLKRAGYAAPTYKAEQLKNKQFQAACEFNGTQIMGRPCNKKKNAENDAAAEALRLLGVAQSGYEYVNRMSTLLKKRKRDHH